MSCIGATVNPVPGQIHLDINVLYFFFNGGEFINYFLSKFWNMEYLYCSCMFGSPNFFFHFWFDGKLKHQFYNWHLLRTQIFQNKRSFRWFWYTLYSHTLQLCKLLHIWSMEMTFVNKTSLNNFSWIPKHYNNLADTKTHFLSGISDLSSIWNCCTFYWISFINWASSGKSTFTKCISCLIRNAKLRHCWKVTDWTVVTVVMFGYYF